MIKLPLNLVVFSTPAGHFGYKEVYKTSINHLEKKLKLLDFDLGLETFGGRFAHIKVRDNENEKKHLPEMVKFFEGKNIKPIITYGNWERGMSHQNEYLKDIAKVFSTQELHYQPYSLWFEDDSPIFIKCKSSLKDILGSSIGVLSSNLDILNVRFVREGIETPKTRLNDFLWRMETFDFQPNISRTRDLYLVSKIIQDNWEYFSKLQCEMAFRIAMSQLSASENRFLGFDTDKVTSYHIGSPDYLDYLKLPDFEGC